jgi:signal transduction histidine kinase
VARTQPTRSILVVDDDEGLLILMAEALRDAGYEVATADSAKAARAALATTVPDLLVLDLKLKDGDGSALVGTLQKEKTLVPFIIVTGRGDEKAAVAVMQQGARDYVMKDTGLIDRLPERVRLALAGVDQEKALAAAQVEHKRLEREVLAVGERERHSIGGDLHDGLGQQLTAIELTCALLKSDAAGHPELAKGLDRMGKMLREAIAQTRFLARGLVPVGSEPEALQNGLTELAARITALGKLRCAFECPHPVLVADSFVAGHLYRIAQEAVNNAIKHSGARRVTIRLAEEGSDLVLSITDDGAGISGKSHGVGLGLMQHRANVIGGHLRIDSKKNHGVAIVCRLPRPQ